MRIPRSTHRSQAAIFLTAALLFGSCSGGGEPEVDEAAPAADEEPEPPDLSGLMSAREHEHLEGERGLLLAEAGAMEGATLLMPLNSTQVHLLDLAGEPVHTWETGLAPGGWSYLMDDGSLLHCGRQDEDIHFRGGGIGGFLTRFAPDGEVLWRFEFSDELACQHHDLEALPNGNLLFIAWERKSAEEAVAMGRHPEGVGAAGLWPDAVYEIRPTPPEGAEIVWSWHAWDHLVQDRDPALPNHGKPSDHPGRIDVNFGFVPPAQISDEQRKAAEEMKRQMAAIGYAGGDDDEEEEEEPDGPPPKEWDKSGDWMHTNAVDYNAELDLIVLSSPEMGEIFVIDHSTSREEAATSKGGRWNRGGDLLWRWGNPQNYGLGGENDQKLFYQHDPTWLGSEDDLRLLVLNNGGRRPSGESFSEVLELTLPLDPATGFLRELERPFGPDEPSWSYADPETFFSAFVSGARRLPNGNTIVCSGVPGRIFEVTPEGHIVWDYYNEHGGDIEPPEHAGKAPPYALFRAERYGPDHPGIQALN